MILKRFLLLTFTGLVLLTSMASCSIPGINSSKNSTTLGVLKKDPTATTLGADGTTKIPFEDFGMINQVKSENGSVVEDGLKDISVNKILQLGYSKFLILTKEKGIFITNDGGRNWERKYIINDNDFNTKVTLNDTLSATSISLDRSNKVIYLGANYNNQSKIFVSKDEGNSFKEIYTDPNNKVVNYLVNNPNKAGEIYASFDNNAVIMTVDSGATWKKIGELKDTIMQLGYMPKTNKLFTLLENDGVSYYSGNGTTWNEESLNLQNSKDKINNNKQIYIYETGDTESPYTYLLAGDKKLWIKNTKEGFVEISLPLSNDENNISMVYPVFNVNNRKFNQIWIAVDSNLYKTLNEGSSWQANDQLGLTGSIGNISDFVIDENDTETYYITLSKEKKSLFSLFK